MTDSPELILSMIACLRAEGQDVREAILEIGEERVQAAMNDALDVKAGRQILDLLAIKGRMDRDDVDMNQALELSEAGWTSEDPRDPKLPAPKTIWEKTAVMSWQWRRPGKRPGKPGRLFLSTNQAWRQLQRERGLL